MRSNVDKTVVAGFGDEWNKFDQSDLSNSELKSIFERYFSIFPWEIINKDSIGFDLGCGSGRWAKFVAPRVKKLYCIDPSVLALEVAQKNLAQQSNCEFHLAGVDNMPLNDDDADFGYSLGVLHHIPDTAQGIAACVSKLKKGAPFLVYLYYSFDNKPLWYRLIWQVTIPPRLFISRLPFRAKYLFSQAIAALVYLPLARLSLLLEKKGFKVDNLPLSAYRSRSFYIMRNDALDRFGTKLERRFSKHEIREMMKNAGLERIVFTDSGPYWCAVGYKK